MPFIKLSKAEKEQILPLLQDYLANEMGCETGELAAEFLLDFFVNNAGKIIYNNALNDARYALEKRLETVVDDTLIELEKR